MDFPMDWVINNAEDYTTAGPGYQGEVTVELLAQLRNTGRILDSFRFTLDGASPLEAIIDVRNIIPADPTTAGGNWSSSSGRGISSFGVI
jgi:hypothetical protein